MPKIRGEHPMGFVPAPAGPPPNRGPTNTVPPSPQTTPVDTPIGLVFGVSDPDALAIAVHFEIVNGTLQVAPAAGAAIAGNDSASVQVQGPLIAVNNSIKLAIYFPAPGFVGLASVTMNSNDGTLQDTDIVQIAVG